MKYILLVLVLLIVGCEEKEQTILKETKTENGWDVQLLFQHEGYKIFRFYDSGYKYFIIPEGKVINVIPGDDDRPEVIEEISTVK